MKKNPIPKKPWYLRFKVMNISKKILLPKFMPITVALIAGAFITSYAGVAALIGGGIGHIFKAILTKMGKLEEVSLIKYSLITVCLISISWILALNIGTQQAVNYEEFSKPRLLSNSGDFIKKQVNHDLAHSAHTRAKLVWDFERNSIAPISRLNSDAQIKIIDSTQMKIVENNTELTNYDL